MIRFLNANRIFLIILLYVFMSFHIVKGDETQEQKVSVTDISTSSKIVDDWKTPGRYAPVNLFDGDVATCFAVEAIRKNVITDSIGVTVLFNKPVNIDEIKIANGFAKSQKTFDENTRLKKLNLYIFKPEGKQQGKDSYILETIELKDVKAYQNVKLSREYFTKKIEMGIGSSSGELSGREPGKYQIFYGGTKYYDICISEIEFYYKGKKVTLTNADKIKKDYASNLHKKLVNAFSDKVYMWGDGCCPYLETYKDGRIEYGRSPFGPKPYNYPDRWKVENAKLYMRCIGTWRLFEYKFGIEDIFLYAPDYNEESCSDGILEHWAYEHELKKKK